MTKDYFQDIIPPVASDSRKGRMNVGVRKVAPVEDVDDDTDEGVDATPLDKDPYPENDMTEDEQDQQDELRKEVGLRGIRNVSIPSRARPSRMSKPRQAPPIMMGGTPSPRTPHSRLWIWIVAGVCILVLALFVILAMRPTVVSLTPRSQAVVFDQSAEFVAYPATEAASGTLPYTVQTIDLEDSEIIPAQGGTTHVETKASGSIVVHNDFSTSPVRLVATTRFETPDHLVFRTPNDIVIPGKKGTTPGQVIVTVVADQAGQQYNTSPDVRFTLPGLQNNAPMHKGVYAESSGQITGGFAGDRTATDPAARATAIANVRGRLQEAALTKATVVGGENTLILQNLIVATFQDLPDTNEANSVGVHQQIRVLVPTIPADLFTQMVAAGVTANATFESLRLVPGEGFMTISTDAASSTPSGDPFHFRLAGNATLVWNIDTQALTQALVGRDQASFKSIVANFPGIESAHARIEPFWKKTFPSNAEDIKVVISDPTQTPQ